MLTTLQELYGNVTAGVLLSVLSRLWTFRLQSSGFTCGIGDLLLKPTAESKRTQLIADAERRATCAGADYCEVSTQSIADPTLTTVRPFSSMCCLDQYETWSSHLPLHWWGVAGWVCQHLFLRETIWDWLLYCVFVMHKESDVCSNKADLASGFFNTRSWPYLCVHNWYDSCVHDTSRLCPQLPSSDH